MEQTYGSVIVIDDERTFANRLDDGMLLNHVRSVGEALTVLVSCWNFYQKFGQGMIDEIWLDHDLGDDGGDINVIVDWLVIIAHQGNAFPVKRIFVHSQNPVGANNIVKRLDGFYNVERVPLPELV